MISCLQHPYLVVVEGPPEPTSARPQLFVTGRRHMVDEDALFAASDFPIAPKELESQPGNFDVGGQKGYQRHCHMFLISL